MRTAALLVFVAMFGATRLNSQTPLFAPTEGPPITVVPGSGTVMLADVTGDGHLDLVTRHLLSRKVGTLLGNGKGGFTADPGRLKTFAYAPADMKLGDVNNDNIIDLVVTSNDRDFVDVFLGSGAGDFTLADGSPFVASSAVQPLNKRGFHLVDINEDGNLDIITVNGRRNAVSTLLGNGRGGFSPGPTSTMEPGRNLYSFAFGDVDGDGHADAVTTCSGTAQSSESGRMMIQRGDGKGAFRNASASPVLLPPGPHFVTLADLNGDQRLDLLISHSSNQLSVLLNNGNGTFVQAAASPYNLGSQAFALAVVDVDRDGTPDIVAATVNSVTVLLGGKRRFVPAYGSPFRAGPGAYNLAVGDVNEDGKLDIAASSFEGNAVTVLLGR